MIRRIVTFIIPTLIQALILTKKRKKKIIESIRIKAKEKLHQKCITHPFSLIIDYGIGSKFTVIGKYNGINYSTKNIRIHLFSHFIGWTKKSTNELLITTIHEYCHAIHDIAEFDSELAFRIAELSTQPEFLFDDDDWDEFFCDKFAHYILNLSRFSPPTQNMCEGMVRRFNKVIYSLTNVDYFNRIG